MKTSKLILIIFLIYNSSLFGLNLDTFIKTCLENHPLAEVSTKEYLQNLADAEKAGAIKDWNLFTSYDFQKGANIPGTTLYNENSTQHILSGGAYKLFSETGTQLSIGTSYTAQMDQPTFIPSLPDDIYSLAFDISFKQPLLKNSFGLLDRYPLKLSEYKAKLATIKYQEDLEDFVVKTSFVYIKWLNSKNIKELYATQLEKAKQQLNIMNKRASRGGAEKLDVILANQNYLAKKIKYKKEAQRFAILSIEARSLLSGSIDIAKQFENVMPSEQDIEIKIPDKSNGLNRFEEKGLALRVLEINREIAKKSLEARNNEKEISINLLGKYQAGATQINPQDVYSHIGTEPIYKLGIEIKHPLENTAADSGYKEELAKYDKITAQNQEAYIRMRNSLEVLYTELEYLDEIITITDDLIIESNKAFKAEDIKYRQGRSYSYSLVLDAQNRLLDTKIQLDSLMLSKHMIKTQISGLLDIYVDKYGLKTKQES
ncbi:MAG: TolC family protein [bacterium]|nr:TolC family protein [Gammaproteobacteria bacterium]MCP4049134.1 TolC family protein [bacterium]